VYQQKKPEGKEGEPGSELVIGGTIQQRITSCFTVLDTFLCLPQDDTQPAVVSSMVVAEKSKKLFVSGSVVDTVGNILGNKIPTLN